MTANPPSSNQKSEIPNPKSSPDRDLLAGLLKFLGLMLTIGGSLAIFRTHGVDNPLFKGPQLFFTLLIPIGLGVWAVGFYLRNASEARTETFFPLPSGGGREGGRMTADQRRAPLLTSPEGEGEEENGSHG